MGSCARAKRIHTRRPNHRHRPANLSNPAARRSRADSGVLRRCGPNQVCARSRGSCWSLACRLGWDCHRGRGHSLHCALQSNGVHQISSGILMVRARGDRQAVLSIGTVTLAKLSQSPPTRACDRPNLVPVSPQGVPMNRQMMQAVLVLSLCPRWWHSSPGKPPRSPPLQSMFPPSSRRPIRRNRTPSPITIRSSKALG